MPPSCSCLRRRRTRRCRTSLSVSILMTASCNARRGGSLLIARATRVLNDAPRLAELPRIIVGMPNRRPARIAIEKADEFSRRENRVFAPEARLRRGFGGETLHAPASRARLKLIRHVQIDRVLAFTRINTLTGVRDQRGSRDGFPVACLRFKRRITFAVYFRVLAEARNGRLKCSEETARRAHTRDSRYRLFVKEEAIPRSHREFLSRRLLFFLPLSLRRDTPPRDRCGGSETRVGRDSSFSGRVRDSSRYESAASIGRL